MRELKQLELFGRIAGQSRQHVEYLPPDPKLVDQYAQEVCGQLVQSGNTACNDPEVVRGFAAFLNFVADVLARQLTKRAHIKEGV
jgi:hypothetical protein